MRSVDLWRGPPLVLASTSLARRDLLEAAGLPFETEAPGIDERALQAALPASTSPAELSAHLAAAKALAVSDRRGDALVIGADQVLACEGEFFSKPEDAAAAVRQIGRLSGRTHVLHSAVAIARGGAILSQGVDQARLTMRRLGPDAVARYVSLAGDAATRSVGGYEIERAGIHLFERIEGAHSTILGLPMLPLLVELRRLGTFAV